MPRSVPLAIGAGLVSALVLLVALSGPFGGFVLAYFTPLPMLFAGLCLGVGSVPLAAATGILVTSVIGNPAAAGVFGGMHALPSWLVVHQALSRRPPVAAGGDRRWTSPGSVLVGMTVLAAVAAVVTSVLGAGAEGIEAAVRSMLDTSLRAAPLNLPEDVHRLVSMLAPFFIGACGASWIVMIVVNAVLAQRLVASRGWNLRPTPSWSALTLPDWVSWPLVGAAAAALVFDGDGGYIARNLVLVFATPFFFVGLAVVHRLCQRLPNPVLLLTAFYVGLALVFLGFAGVVTALGIVEQWFGIRRRIAGAAPDQENE